MPTWKTPSSGSSRADGRDPAARAITATEVGTLEPAQVVPDTAMHSLVRSSDGLEAAVRTPVLTVIEVTVWSGLSPTGRIPALDGLGTLVRQPMAAKA